MLQVIGMCDGGGLSGFDAVAGGAVRVVADAERLLHKARTRNSDT